MEPRSMYCENSKTRLCFPTRSLPKVQAQAQTMVGTDGASQPGDYGRTFFFTTCVSTHLVVAPSCLGPSRD